MRAEKVTVGFESEWWVAIGDASPHLTDSLRVVIPVRYVDGGEGFRVFARDTEIPAKGERAASGARGVSDGGRGKGKTA